MRTKEGKQQMYAAVDRTSKYVYASVYDRKTNQTAVEFLKELLEIVPYKIHTILTDNGRQFTIPVRSKKSSLSIFDKLCEKEGIRHKLTKPYHPWTNGQVERMNRTIKKATVYLCYYVSSEKLKRHLYAFLNAYNFAKRLKTLKGLTPYEFIKHYWTQKKDYWTQKPEVFKVKPLTLI